MGFSGQRFGKLTASSHVEMVDGDAPKSDPPKTYRLIIHDEKSGGYFLIDTGADISVIPRAKVNGVSLVPADYKLYAANNSVIHTYGQKNLSLDLRLRRNYTWKFTVADVSRCIIRADFLVYYGLLVDLKGKQLVDKETNLSSIGILSYEAHSSISTVAGNSPFRDLLAEFSAITRPFVFSKVPTHDVQHHIVTKGAPIAERARRLTGEKLDAAKSDFKLMMEQGICHRSNSQ